MMTGTAGVFLAVAAGWLVLAGVLSVRADRRAGGQLTGAVEAGYLRDGARGALAVTLTALHLRGSVDVGRPGTVRVAGPLDGVREPLQRVVHISLQRPIGHRSLAAKGRVAAELEELRQRLVADGLLRGRGEWRAIRGCLVAAAATVVAGLMAAPFGGPNSTAQHIGSGVLLAADAALWRMPRRTHAARTALARTRERFPLPPVADGPAAARRQKWSVESALLRIGLYGEPALLATAPHFARGSGLLASDRRSTDDPSGYHEPAADTGISHYA